MFIACFDLEGVFTPEVWIEVSRITGIKELSLTTRDVADYDQLMRGRLAILDRHGIGLPKIQSVIAGIRPLPGAREFLEWMRRRCPVVVLSDTYYEFADPLMEQLGRPTLFCHSLEVEPGGRIAGYRLRLKDSKRQAILAFRGIGFRTLAVGDSFNDVSMIKEADTGLFFRAPEAVRRQYPRFKAAESYEELKTAIEEVLAS